MMHKSCEKKMSLRVRLYLECIVAKIITSVVCVHILLAPAQLVIKMLDERLCIGYYPSSMAVQPEGYG